MRKELKKAFRMEVDISTKELMRKHERLAREVFYCSFIPGISKEQYSLVIKIYYKLFTAYQLSKQYARVAKRNE